MVFDRQYILTELAPQITRKWRESPSRRPDFLPVYDDAAKRENEERLTCHRESLESQFNSFPYPLPLPAAKKKWKEKTEQLLNEILWTEQILNVSSAMTKDVLEEFKSQARQMLSRIRAFDAELGMEDIGQAMRNYIVYAVFLELNGLPQRCCAAIFGYSMLYPYTDNFIDDPERTAEEKQHYNQMIEDILLGRPAEILSRHEGKTAELLAAIGMEYDSTDEIFQGLFHMLEAQRRSLVQSDREALLQGGDILDISVYKGGMSVLIDRYFINMPMEKQDELFYFGFGFLLQICDDIQDIAGDSHEGSRTLLSACDSQAEVEAQINRLLHYTRELFETYHSRNEKFKTFLLQNTYLLILFSAAGSREYVPPEWTRWMEERMPVSVAYMDGMKRSFAARDTRKLREEQVSPGKGYMKILDAMLEA